MNSFLNQLIAREQQSATLVQPRPIARFEPNAVAETAETLPMFKPENLTEQVVSVEPQLSDRNSVSASPEGYPPFPHSTVQFDGVARMPTMPTAITSSQSNVSPTGPIPILEDSPQPQETTNTYPQLNHQYLSAQCYPIASSEICQ